MREGQHREWEHPLLRVKVIGGWGPPEQVCRQWSLMSEGDGRWIDVQVTPDDDADFFVIVNFPRPQDTYRPERTIVLQMEPWCFEEYQRWGVKTWREWSTPDPSRFLQVRSHRFALNTATWLFDASYRELRHRTFPKSGQLSAVVGAKYIDPGHIKRVDFLRYLDTHPDDVVQMHLYNDTNPHGLGIWAGSGSKETAYYDYRYVLAVENNAEHNYITEKLWEPLIAEALPFYWGAPNVADHVDPRAFISLDLDDFDKAHHTIKQAMLNDEWSRRLEFIRRERVKALEYHQFFPMLRRILRDEMRFTGPPTDDDVTYHKYFAADLGAQVGCAVFIWCDTRDGDRSAVSTVLDRLARSGVLETVDRLFLLNVGDELAPPSGVPGVGTWLRVINVGADRDHIADLLPDMVRVYAARHATAVLGSVDVRGVDVAVFDRFASVVDAAVAARAQAARGESVLASVDAPAGRRRAWWSPASSVSSPRSVGA